jgi:hypothetical protein
MTAVLWKNLRPPGHGAAGTEDSPKTQTFAPSSRNAQTKDEREMSDMIGR